MKLSVFFRLKSAPLPPYGGCLAHKLTIWGNKRYRAVAVAHLVERSLPTSKIRGSNIVIDNCIHRIGTGTECIIRAQTTIASV